jgi:hypothetical protein
MESLKTLLREARLTFPTAFALVFGLLVVQGALEKFGEWMTERQAARQERIDYAEWINESCLPRTPGQRGIAQIEDGKLACRIYSNLEYGMAPAIVSAAVMELTQ